MSTARDFGDLIRNAKGLQPPQPANEDFHPKYVPLRPDQITNLDVVARELMATRSVKGGPRITANTLIRVAVDTLIAQRDRLDGDNETALRRAYFAQLGLTEDGERTEPAAARPSPPPPTGFVFPVSGAKAKGSKDQGS